MRIVFIGAVEFSRHALARLIEMGAEVVGVLTLEASSFNSDHVDLSSICASHDLECRYAPDVNAPEVLAWIAERRPDVIFCFGWSRLLKRPLLDAAPLGVVGYHPTLLPANRGRHPIIWALVLGLQETGSTFFFMGEGADTGDILSQERIAITRDDDARSLYDKLVTVALGQIREFTPQLADGTFQRRRQNEQHATTWRKRSRIDGQIDWRMSADAVYNLVRGLTRPYPGAEALIDGAAVKVWKAEPIAIAPQNAEPGRVLRIDRGTPVIKCGEGAIQLIETEPSVQLQAGQYL